MNYFKRIGLLFVLLIFNSFWNYSQTFLSGDHTPSNILLDRIHDSHFVTGIINYMSNNKYFTDFNLILTTFLLDATIIIMMGLSLWRLDMRVPTMMISGIVLRQICQPIVKLPIPENMIWYDPGFPTLFMVYEVRNDFFFSGHTLTSLILGGEIIQSNNNLFIKLYGYIFIIYEIIFVIVTRSHYFMDVYAAIATYFSLKYFIN